jgi:uncharacterized protein (DUF58 family)
MPWRPSRRRPVDHGDHDDGPLLDSALLRQLELLSLDSLDALLSPLEGQHAGLARAGYGELSDYRGYQPGDDPRLVDWNAYARLDELFVRTTAAHQGMLLTVLIDCSRSMAVPGPPPGTATSLRFAKQVAAAFGAVALLRSDAVRVCALADGAAWTLPVASGRTAVGQLLDSLGSLPAGGRTDLPASLRAARPTGREASPGPTVLLSDLLIPDGPDWALDLLGPAGVVVHVPEAGDPLGREQAGATVEVRDAETGEVVTVTVTPASRRRYSQLTRARDEAMAARCAAAGVGYLRAPRATPVADLLFGYAAGVLRPAARLAAGLFRWTPAGREPVPPVRVI